MRRKTTLKRSRQRRVGVVHVVLAAGVGYWLGGSHITAMRSTNISAAETVALRFPEMADSGTVGSGMPPSSAPISAGALSSAALAAAATKNAAPNIEIALLSPEPTVLPETVPQVSALQVAATSGLPADQQTPAQTADAVGLPPLPDTLVPVSAPAVAPSKIAAVRTIIETKAAAVRHAIANRPGYMLNDAQIASIKQRLNLTLDQQRMWPAVEAALRNMAYTHAQQVARGRGSSTAVTQTAAVDPDAVQGLKSAAVPLVMSFNTEQKEEVRNLVHVMGLDQLASEF
jgi:hypothetical protein